MGMTTMLPADPTLDEIREALAPLVADNAAFDGWKAAARDMAADQLGVDRDVALLALPDAAAMIDAWFASVDRGMVEKLPPEVLGKMKVREKIAALVEARLDLLAPHRETLRRALAILAMPTNVAHGAKLGWRAADLMWRAAGDTATDYNHYTKRLILSGVYTSTLLVWIDDQSEGWSETKAFLDRRLQNVMQFEKWKTNWRNNAVRRPSLSRFLGRLRYPPR